MEAQIGNVVMPGDVLSHQITSKINKKQRIIIGPGLRRGNDDELIICRAGVLRCKNPSTFWVDCYQKRYVPVKGEWVIGIVTNKGTETARVDIGSSEQATLPYLAFEGATKKYKPDISIGDVVYAQVSIGGCDIEPELVCIDSNFKKQRFGVLTDGFLFTCSLNLVYKLGNAQFPLIETLGKSLKFEIALGLNGRIWLKADSCQATIVLVNALIAAEFIGNEQVKGFCQGVCARFMNAGGLGKGQEMDTS